MSAEAADQQPISPKLRKEIIKFAEEKIGQPVLLTLYALVMAGASVVEKVIPPSEPKSFISYVGEPGEETRRVDTPNPKYNPEDAHLTPAKFVEHNQALIGATFVIVGSFLILISDEDEKKV